MRALKKGLQNQDISEASLLYAADADSDDRTLRIKLD